MNFLVIVCFICILIQSSLSQRRIINGTETDIKLHPYQILLLARIEELNEYLCGGSILNKYTILTAAHCVDNIETAKLTIHVGSEYYARGEIYKVALIIKHPKYNKITINNDVAILKLQKPLTFNDKVQPIALQPANVPVPPGTRANVTGWGATSPDGSLIPFVLHAVQLDVISNAECERKYGENEITPQMLCTHTENKDACIGDSGGPLVANGKLIGVVSWGMGCDSKYPGVYANVTDLRGFIDKCL